MFFKPLCKGSCRLPNVFFITFNPVAFVSVDDSTFVEDEVFIFRSHQEVFDCMSSFTVHLDSILLTDSLNTFT